MSCPAQGATWTLIAFVVSSGLGKQRRPHTGQLQFFNGPPAPMLTNVMQVLSEIRLQPQRGDLQ